MHPVSTPWEVLCAYAIMDTLAMDHFVKVSLLNVMQQQNSL